MSDSEVKDRCPKCQGFMIQGFVLDLTHGSQSVSTWAEGAPEKTFFGGTRTRGRKLPIGAFRCERCGFLEFYARHKFAAQ